MKNIIETLGKWMEPVKEFMVRHQSNPILWLALFGLGIFVFVTVYRALQKEK
ncbi:MAG: hypothetical protein HFI86_01970 [Bacilli bacterium]|nr:hypothetical protein [Bacilli bacterium]MCI9434030.1 hypothetical protein [Bacilli bacterium]